MEAFSDNTKNKIAKEISYSTSKSTGPGGQHVNKVNTRVELRFIVIQSEYLSQFQKDLIFDKLKNRINKEGELILACQESRSQAHNKEMVLLQFFSLIENALRPTKKRRPTKPTFGSVQKRLNSKKHLAELKKSRKRIKQ